MSGPKGAKILKGQVWMNLTRKAPDGGPLLVLLTAGGDSPKGKNIDRPHIHHHFKPKSLWLYYQLIGTANNYQVPAPAVAPRTPRPLQTTQ